MDEIGKNFWKLCYETLFHPDSLLTKKINTRTSIGFFLLATIIWLTMPYVPPLLNYDLFPGMFPLQRFLIWCVYNLIVFAIYFVIAKFTYEENYRVLLSYLPLCYLPIVIALLLWPYVVLTYLIAARILMSGRELWFSLVYWGAFWLWMLHCQSRVWSKGAKVSSGRFFLAFAVGLSIQIISLISSYCFYWLLLWNMVVY
jgi:hypothetical protein